jgi:hypothetical protein
MKKIGSNVSFLLKQRRFGGSVTELAFGTKFYTDYRTKKLVDRQSMAVRFGKQSVGGRQIICLPLIVSYTKGLHRGHGGMGVNYVLYRL